MRDSELRSQTDYSAGQIEAAHRVIVEIVNILHEYEDDILIVGGWVPDLLFPDRDHIGSIDVDVLVNHLSLEEVSYATIERILLNNGYTNHSEKYFTFIKKVVVDEVEFTPEHAGPADIASFLEVYDDEEIDMVKRDAFEQVNRLLGLLLG